MLIRTNNFFATLWHRTSLEGLMLAGEEWDAFRRLQTCMPIIPYVNGFPAVCSLALSLIKINKEKIWMHAISSRHNMFLQNNFNVLVEHFLHNSSGIAFIWSSVSTYSTIETYNAKLWLVNLHCRNCRVKINRDILWCCLKNGISHGSIWCYVRLSYSDSNYLVWNIYSILKIFCFGDAPMHERTENRSSFLMVFLLQYFPAHILFWHVSITIS